MAKPHPFQTLGHHSKIKQKQCVNLHFFECGTRMHLMVGPQSLPLQTIGFTPKDILKLYLWGAERKQIIYSFDIIDDKSQKTNMEPQLYTKSRIAFIHHNKLALLHTTVPSNDHCSHSFILSMAEFLNNIRGLTPPTITILLKNNPASHDLLPPSEHSYFQPWCEYLFQLLTEGSIVGRGDELILVGRLDAEAFNVAETSGAFEIKPNATGMSLTISSTINLLQGYNTPPAQIHKKVAIINFASSVLIQDPFKPRINIDGLLSGIFYNPGDSWRSFRILKGDVPQAEELAQFDTLILSGSSYSVNGMAPQMEQFQQVLMQALNINPKLKAIGICFGHQFLAKTKTIEVVTKPLNKGLQNINFSFEDHTDAEYLQDFLKSELRYLRMYKYHSDHVTSVHESFIKFGESSKCSLQSVISKDKRILSFQFHPEYSEEYIHNYEERLIKYCQPEYYVEGHKKRDDFHHKSMDIMRKTMRRFINWNAQL